MRLYIFCRHFPHFHQPAFPFPRFYHPHILRAAYSDQVTYQRACLWEETRAPERNSHGPRKTMQTPHWHWKSWLSLRRWCCEATFLPAIFLSIVVCTGLKHEFTTAISKPNVSVYLNISPRFDASLQYFQRQMFQIFLSILLLNFILSFFPRLNNRLIQLVHCFQVRPKILQVAL